MQGGRVDVAFFETLAQLSLRPETRLYLGLVHPDDGLVGAKARIVAAQRFVHDFGVATDCGWGRHRPQEVETLLELHREVTTPIQPSLRATQPFEWPPGWERIPPDSWTHDPVDAFGAAYDNVDHHGWYRNLDPTVEELAAPAERRRGPHRLLGRHRHPARPPEVAHVRHPGRSGHRRQLAQVPARRAGEVPRRSRRSAFACCGS